VKGENAFVIGGKGNIDVTPRVPGWPEKKKGKGMTYVYAFKLKQKKGWWLAGVKNWLRVPGSCIITSASDHSVVRLSLDRFKV